MLDVFLRSGKREHEAEDQKKGNVEAGADHHAHVERAAAAAAFDVRWHAHLWYLCVPQAQMLIDVLPLRAVARARAAVTAARRQLQGDLCWVLIDGAARWRSLTIQVRQVCTQRKDAVVYLLTPLTLRGVIYQPTYSWFSGRDLRRGMRAAPCINGPHTDALTTC